MSLRAHRHRPALLATVLALASLLSCGREFTGPGGPGRPGEVQLNPVFETVRLGGDGRVLSIGEVVEFATVRVVLVRANGDTVVDRLVAFPPDSASVRLAFNVTLSDAATSAGEPLDATLKFINAAGDTVFSGGPLQVLAKSTGSSSTPPPEIPVRYVGAGANAAAIAISPTSHVGLIGTTVGFTAVVTDSLGGTIGTVPVAYTSTDSARVRVNLRTGLAQLIGARGTVAIIAQTLTGQADTATVTITPTAAAILFVSGGNQTTRQGSAFPAPVRVRVNAADGVGVAGVPVTFAVTRGQGSATPTNVATDANGFAETNWTAGDSAGVGQLRASVDGTSFSVTTDGTQLSAAPTALTFETQPANFTAGDTIPPLTVVVRDATADTVVGFNGAVTLELAGGAAGAAIVGVATRNAVNGVVSFPNLTIDRGGSGYRFRAVVAGVPPATTNTFDVAAAPARFVTILGGGGQTAPPLATLADTIRIRVTDGFSRPVAGVGVSFSVAAGGGSVSPANATTDSVGVVKARWTLGPSGAQQLTATVAGLTPAVVNASVFVPAGTPTLFAGVSGASMVVGSSRTIPIFIEPVSAVPIVATLTVRDTSIARWAVDSVIFAAGASLRSPVIQARASGFTWAIITSSIGTDSVQVEAQPASIDFGNYSSSAVSTDTLRSVVRLSAPAPAGGIVVTVVSEDTSVVLVAPSAGDGEPEYRCDNYYCGGLRAEPVPGLHPSLLAPPADTAFVTIPEGGIEGHLALLPRAPGTGRVTASAPAFAVGERYVYVQPATLDIDAYPFEGQPVGVGTHVELRVSLSSALRRDLPVRLTSRDTTRLRVDSVALIKRHEGQAYGLPVRVLGAGIVTLVAEADGFATDSIQFEVVDRRLFVSDRAPVVSPSTPFRLDVGLAADSLGTLYGYWPQTNEVPISASSSDPTVLQVELGASILFRQTYASVRLRSGAAGSAWLRVTSPGIGTDSVLVTVARQAVTIYDASNRIGVGQVHESYSIYLPTSPSGDYESRSIQVSSSDPAIAEVLTPDLASYGGYYLNAPRILGRAPGTVTLTFTGADIDTTTTVLQVVQPTLRFAGIGASSASYNADSARYGVALYTGHDPNVTRAPVESLTAVLRSTNPAVLLVTDSIIHFQPGNYYNTTGAVRFIAPGNAQLIAEAPGYVPDTSAMLTGRPFRLEVSAATVTTGVGLAYPLTLFRRSLTGAALPVTVSTRGPAGVTVRETNLEFAAGQGTLVFTTEAASTFGVDTVTFSAAGHDSASVRFTVGSSRITAIAGGSVLVGQDLAVSARLRAAAFFASLAPTDTVRLVARSRDSSVVRIVDDTIRFVPGGINPSIEATARGARPGSAWIILEDPQGRFATDSVRVFVNRQALDGSRTRFDLGMNQRTYGGELYVYRPYATTDSLWVRFSSSVPGIARTVQDSVLLLPDEQYAYFDVIAFDSVGGVEIRGAADGFLDLSLTVSVGRPSLVPYTMSSVTVGEGAPIEIYVSSGSDYQARETTAEIPYRITSETPGLLAIGADSIGTIPAGASYTSGLGPAIGLARGPGRFAVSDRRSGVFQSAMDGWDAVDIDEGRLQFSAQRLSLATGFRTSNQSIYASNSSAADRWIQVRSVGGRVQVLGDSLLLPAYNSSVYPEYVGLTAGVDTIVVSGAGLRPDTLIATVGDARVETYGFPPVLTEGDSVLVYAYVRTGDNNTATANTPVELTLATTGGIEARSAAGTGPITSITLDEDEYQVTFYIRATSATLGEIVISGPGVEPKRFRIVTRAR